MVITGMKAMAKHTGEEVYEMRAERLTLQAGESTLVQVTLKEGKEALPSTLCIASNDPVTPLLPVQVRMNVTGVARIDVLGSGAFVESAIDFTDNAPITNHQLFLVSMRGERGPRAQLPGCDHPLRAGSPQQTQCYTKC